MHGASGRKINECIRRKKHPTEGQPAKGPGSQQSISMTHPGIIASHWQWATAASDTLSWQCDASSG